MNDCNGTKTPVVPGTDVFGAQGESYDNINWFQMMMGKLILYLATHTRPDICFIVGRMCAFMHCPTVNHVNILRRILRYLKQTKDHLVFSRGKVSDVNIYCKIRS